MKSTTIDSKKMRIVKGNNINLDEVKREFGELLDYLGENVERD